METTEEKAFRDQQLDAKRALLERNLKRAKIQKLHDFQPTASPRMSISGISSIHGDNPTLDLSYSSSSISSIRAGSVVIAASNNFRKKIAKSPQTSLNPRHSTSSVFEHTSDTLQMQDDRAMMPPPALINTGKSSSVNQSPQNDNAVESIAKTSVPCHSQSNDKQMRDHRSTSETSYIEHDVLSKVDVNKDPSKHEKSQQNGRMFRKWTVQLDKRGGLIIRGKLDSGQQARSKAVMERLSADTVLSVHNHKYRLLGNIHDVQDELPEYVRGKFFNGFPTDWENVRQVWKNYIAFGSNSRFRWPRPMADSDDDLRSDITDLTVPRIKASRSQTTPSVTTPQPLQTSTTVNETNRKRDIRSHQKAITEDSPISSIDITPTQNSHADAKSPAVGPSTQNIEYNSSPILVDRSSNRNHSTKKLSENEQSTKIENKDTLKRENFIPRWKVDVIIDNLLNNKHCRKEYIEKIIMAIDCINELVSMSPTNNAESTPDKSSFHNNSECHTDIMSDQIPRETINPEILHNTNGSEPSRSRTVGAGTNCYSSDSWSESEEEPLSNRRTFVPEVTPVLKQSSMNLRAENSQVSRISVPTVENSPNYRNAVNRNLNNSTPVRYTGTRQHIRHPTNNNNHVTPDSPILPAVQYDSDITIIEPHITPHKKSLVSNTDNMLECQKIQNTQQKKPQSNFSFMQRESNDQTRTNASVVDQNAIVSDKRDTRTGSPSVRSLNECIVQLNKIPIDRQNNENLPSKSKEALQSTGRPKRKVVKDRQANENSQSNSENISMRLSSRGRRILPPLSYWNGERVTLKDRELVYSPSTCRPASLSATSTMLKRSFLSPNTTAVSDPTLATRNPNEPPVGLTSHTNSTIVSADRCTQQPGGILTEITANNNQTSEGRLTRRLLNNKSRTSNLRKIRNVNKDSETSSDEEKIQLVPNRKRRRIN